MGLIFAPYSDDELAGEFLTEGEADGEVIKSEFKHPIGGGDEYLHLECKVIDCKGQDATIFKNVSCSEKARWALAQFCKAIDKKDILKTGRIENASFCYHAKFKCYIAKGDLKKNGRSYFEIKYFIEPLPLASNVSNAAVYEKIPPTEDLPFNDDIPWS